MLARYIDFFYSSSGWFDCTEHRTSSNPLELHSHRDSKVYRVLLHEFGVVRLDRTSGDHASKVYRLLLLEFGVVRLYRTSNLIEPSRTTFSQR